MKKLTPRQINAQRKREDKPPLNFRLLRKLVKKLETNPEAYNQGVWGQPNKSAPCGTAACIAGWACVLNGDLDHKQLRRNPKSASTKATKSLGLKVDLWTDRDERETLFAGDPYDAWPEPFASRWVNAGYSTKKQAKVAVAYLKHIIATGDVVGTR